MSKHQSTTQDNTCYLNYQRKENKLWHFYSSIMLPSLLPCGSCHSKAQVPSRAKFHEHHLKLTCVVSPLTSPDHQSKNVCVRCQTQALQKWLPLLEDNNVQLSISHTLQTGLCGSLIFTNRFSHFKSKWTMFFPCKYSIPKAASIAMMSLLRRSMVLFKIWQCHRFFILRMLYNVFLPLVIKFYL
jgi:hypothetical protein